MCVWLDYLLVRGVFATPSHWCNFWYLITCNQCRPHNRPQLQPSNKDLRARVLCLYSGTRVCTILHTGAPQPPMPLGPLNNSSSNEVKGASVQNGIALEDNWWGVCCGTVMSQTSAVRESISYYDARSDVSIMLPPSRAGANISECVRACVCSLPPACSMCEGHGTGHVSSVRVCKRAFYAR